MGLSLITSHKCSVISPLPPTTKKYKKSRIPATGYQTVRYIKSTPCLFICVYFNEHELVLAAVFAYCGKSVQSGPDDDFVSVLERNRRQHHVRVVLGQHVELQLHGPVVGGGRQVTRGEPRLVNVAVREEYRAFALCAANIHHLLRIDCIFIDEKRAFRRTKNKTNKKNLQSAKQILNHDSCPSPLGLENNDNTV